MTRTQTPATLLARLEALDPDTASPKDIRDAIARARRAGRTDLLPSWVLASINVSARRAAAHITAPPPKPPSLTHIDPATILEAKARTSGISPAILRTVYCREMTSTTPLPHHVSREYCAHARVNSFIRLSEGDPTARTDDADLLSLLS
jgi:hypothetical protein